MGINLFFWTTGNIFFRIDPRLCVVLDLESEAQLLRRVPRNMDTRDMARLLCSYAQVEDPYGSHWVVEADHSHPQSTRFPKSVAEQNTAKVSIPGGMLALSSDLWVRKYLPCWRQLISMLSSNGIKAIFASDSHDGAV